MRWLQWLRVVVPMCVLLRCVPTLQARFTSRPMPHARDLLSASPACSNALITHSAQPLVDQGYSLDCTARPAACHAALSPPAATEAVCTASAHSVATRQRRFVTSAQCALT